MLRLATSPSPRTARTKPTPASGTRRRMVRSGQSCTALSRPGEEVERDEGGDADQDGKGVMIHVAGLERAGAARQVLGRGGDAVGADAVDQRAVAALPQAAAQHHRRLDEHPVVELVEVPLVENEEIEATET